MATVEDGRPIQNEIAETVKQASDRCPPDEMTEGRIACMVNETAIKGATPAKVDWHSCDVK
jgi:hypothetical protein